MHRCSDVKYISVVNQGFTKLQTDINGQEGQTFMRNRIKS